MFFIKQVWNSQENTQEGEAFMKKILMRSLIAILIVFSLIAAVGLAVSAADNSVPAGTPGIVAYATVNGQTKYYTDFNKLVKDASGTSANDRWKVYEITICAEEVTMNNPLVISDSVKVKAAAGVTPTVKVNTTQNYNGVAYRGAFVTASAANKVEVEGVDFVITTNTGADGKGALVQLNSTTENVALAPGQKCELIFNDVNVTSSECIISQYTPSGGEVGRYEITVNGGTWTANNGNGDFIYVPGSATGEKLKFTFSATNATLNVANIYNGPNYAGFMYSLKKLTDNYMAANPGVAKHTITASHKVVYDSEAYFQDCVNGTQSYFSYYSKLGADAIKAALGERSTTVSIITDSTAASGKEILVGTVERAATKSFLSGMDANEFGIKVTQDNIIITAWNDNALKAAVDVFTGYLSTEALSLPVGFEFIGVADDAWKVDFVRPDNTALSAGQYVNDDSLQFLYTGNGATNAGYKAYCEKLVNNGFTLVWTNTVGNNEFRMYKNATKDIALYVAYNDFTYGSGITATSDLPGDYEKCIRIVSAPLSSTVLPDATSNKFGAPQSYTKITDSYLTTLGISEGNVGTGHVIMLEDGSFIVIDGGNCKVKNGSSYTACSGNAWCDHTNLIWNTLNDLYKKAHGHAPTQAEPIRVSAWYLTHAHDDHYTAFYNMVNLIDKDSSKKAIFELDYIIANLPGRYSLLDGSSATWGFTGGFDKMKNLLGGIKTIKVHTGQKLYFANLTIEVLATYEDLLPFLINNSNDTNAITRFNFESTNNGEKGVSTSVVFLGDAWRASSRYMRAMYGNYLKSDIVQVSHHGNIGAEQELYDLIKPSAAIFNNTLNMFRTYAWNSYTGTNPESRRAYAVSKYVVRELTSVKYVFTAVEGMKPTVKISTAGAEYETAFNLVNGSALSYKSPTASKNNQTGFINNPNVTLHKHSYQYTFIDASTHSYECSCGHKGQSAHTPEADDGNCTTAIKCKDCDSVVVAAKAHEAEADDNNCATATKCKHCNYIFVPAKSHTPAADDGDCTTAIMCTDCGRVVVAANSHTPMADDNDCTTAIKCARCNCIVTPAKAAHEAEADDNNCATATKCKHCNYIFVPAKSHTPAADDGDCTTAIMCTDCGRVVAAANSHTPETDDGDCTTESKCAVCGCVVVEAKEHVLDKTGAFCQACGMTFDTEPVDTEPVTTKSAVTTTPAATDLTVEIIGCKGTLGTASLALIASLGACAIFVEKKKK